MATAAVGIGGGAMRALYIVRHGIALPHDTPDVADDDRPLTPEGEARTREVAHGLKTLKVRVDAIATSPLPRARRTAEIVAEVLGLMDVLEDADILRAGNEAEVIAEWLATRGEASLMVVGHNPGVSDLVGLLLGNAGSIGELRRVGVAALVDEGSGWRLDWLARPRLLRGLS